MTLLKRLQTLSVEHVIALAELRESCPQAVLVDILESHVDYRTKRLSANSFIILARLLQRPPEPYLLASQVFFHRVCESRADVLSTEFVSPFLRSYMQRASWQMCLAICTQSFVLNSHAPSTSEVNTLLASCAFLGRWQDILFYTQKYTKSYSCDGGIAECARCVAESQMGRWEQCLQSISKLGSPTTTSRAFHEMAVEQTVQCCIRVGVVRPDTMALLNRSIRWV